MLLHDPLSIPLYKPESKTRHSLTSPGSFDK